MWVDGQSVGLQSWTGGGWSDCEDWFGPDWAPGLELDNNDRSQPFHVGGCGAEGHSVGSDAGMAFDLGGLKVSYAAIYQWPTAPGQAQARTDGRTITDNLRYFATANVDSCWLDLDNADHLDRVAMASSPYVHTDLVFKHALLHLQPNHANIYNTIAFKDYRGLTLSTRGDRGPYGIGIGIGYNLYGQVDDCVLSAGGWGIGFLDYGASYTWDLDRCLGRRGRRQYPLRRPGHVPHRHPVLQRPRAALLPPDDDRQIDADNIFMGPHGPVEWVVRSFDGGVFICRILSVDVEHQEDSFHGVVKMDSGPHYGYGGWFDVDCLTIGQWPAGRPIIVLDDRGIANRGYFRLGAFLWYANTPGEMSPVVVTIGPGWYGEGNLPVPHPEGAPLLAHEGPGPEPRADATSGASPGREGTLTAMPAAKDLRRRRGRLGRGRLRRPRLAQRPRLRGRRRRLLRRSCGDPAGPRRLRGSGRRDRLLPARHLLRRRGRHGRLLPLGQGQSHRPAGVRQLLGDRLLGRRRDHDPGPQGPGRPGPAGARGGGPFAPPDADVVQGDDQLRGPGRERADAQGRRRLLRRRERRHPQVRHLHPGRPGQSDRGPDVLGHHDPDVAAYGWQRVLHFEGVVVSTATNLKGNAFNTAAQPVLYRGCCESADIAFVDLVNSTGMMAGPHLLFESTPDGGLPRFNQVRAYYADSCVTGAEVRAGECLQFADCWFTGDGGVPFHVPPTAGTVGGLALVGCMFTFSRGPGLIVGKGTDIAVVAGKFFSLSMSGGRACLEAAAGTKGTVTGSAFSNTFCSTRAGLAFGDAAAAATIAAGATWAYGLNHLNGLAFGGPGTVVDAGGNI